jgi:predicted ATPase/class 3 adenylate cyclase/Tfp pilus assembly protein PilF
MAVSTTKGQHDMPVFLFTDIEGSTQLWEHYKQQMSEALARHDHILREQIQRYGGEIIKSTGDGVFAVFHGRDALSCTLEIQKQLAQQDWGVLGSLKVRAALHAGDAEQRDGDWFGPVVNRAARLIATGWGGQILFTPEVLRCSSLPDGASMHDLGVHLLKDLGEPQQIFELLHPDMNWREFPPLRSLSTRSHNLPAQQTPFLGREEELAQIAQRLQNPNCRLLTLVGPGGTGKTRLSIHTAAEKIEEFSHGVYFVSLAPLASPDVLVSTVADSVGFTFYGPTDPKVQLLTYLRDKSMLLVMDNFEHLIEGAGLIADILTSAPEIKMIATSRERLNLHGEWIFEVGGMRVPDGELVGELEEYSAVQLFLQNARRVRPTFALTQEDRPWIAQICRLVEGLPLGIELAATWVRMLTCEEIAREISSNIDFLESSMRDLPDRHRSLRAVFDYSWNLLTEMERKALRKLGIFRGGFQREAAARVANASLPLLTSLVDKSLLRRTPQGRYEMHEVLRQYAEEKLRESNQEWEKALSTHATYYMELLKAREEDLMGEQQREALDAISLELENVRAAWTWALEHADPEVYDQALDALYHFYEIRGWFQEGQERFAQAVQRLIQQGGRRAGSGDLKGIILSRALSRQGRLAYRLGSYGQATEVLQEGLALARRHGVWHEVAFALNNLGSVSYALGEYQEARQLHYEGLTIYRELDDERGVASALNNLGVIAESQSEYAEAKQLFEEAIGIFEEIGDRRGVARGLSNLGVVAESEGDYQEAEELYTGALEICREIGERWGQAASLNNLGYVANALEDYPAAQQYFYEALQATMAIRAVPVALDVLAGLALSYVKTGRRETALNLLAMVLYHPASLKHTRGRAEQMVQELQAELPHQIVMTAKAKGRMKKFEETVATVLAQREQPMAEVRWVNPDSGTEG